MSKNHHCRGERIGRGPSSFGMQDSESVFRRLELKPGMTFVDAGCGAGEYSLRAARQLGETGRVVALDAAAQSIDWLNANGRTPGAAPILGQVCDITASLPLEDQQADVVMLGTVLHIKSVRDRADSLFSEIRRILRPQGLLAVLECNKEEANFGPPLHSRLSPDDVEALALPRGFVLASVLPLNLTYLACFHLR